MNRRQMRLYNLALASAKGFAAATSREACPACSRRKMRSACCDAAALRASARRTNSPETEIQSAVQVLESEAVRRALSGVEVPVFHQGRECGSTVKHSDQLLMFLLKTLRPERYGGGKESAADLPARTFALEIDLSAAGEGEGQAPDGSWDAEGRTPRVEAEEEGEGGA